MVSLNLSVNLLCFPGILLWLFPVTGIYNIMNLLTIYSHYEVGLGCQKRLMNLKIHVYLNSSMGIDGFISCFGGC